MKISKDLKHQGRKILMADVFLTVTRFLLDIPFLTSIFVFSSSALGFIIWFWMKLYFLASTFFLFFCKIWHIASYHPVIMVYSLQFRSIPLSLLQAFPTTPTLSPYVALMFLASTWATRTSSILSSVPLLTAILVGDSQPGTAWRKVRERHMIDSETHCVMWMIKELFVWCV